MRMTLMRVSLKDFECWDGMVFRCLAFLCCFLLDLIDYPSSLSYEGIHATYITYALLILKLEDSRALVEVSNVPRVILLSLNVLHRH